MNLLFLRGREPANWRDSVFRDLETCDDMWTLLVAELADQSGGYAESWHEVGEWVARYRPNFVERWMHRYHLTTCTFKPDVVFVRGGFDFQINEAVRHAAAVKVYYGAGERVVPSANQPWDLVLADTEAQARRIQRRGYRAHLWIKPAAENVFRPVSGEKRYDVIYVANWNPSADKGHKFLLRALADYRVLHVGKYRRVWMRFFPRTTFSGWVSRPRLPELYASAKLAAVMTRGKDSCPRVVPEALACNCPVVVGRSTKLHPRYVTEQTGCWFGRDDFHTVLRAALARYDSFEPRAYYEQNLSLSASARDLLGAIRAAGFNGKHASL